MNRAAASSIHATAVVVGEAGILIRGASGAGKTGLALALVEEARTRGRFGRLVADDRVMLECRHGRLVARPHPAIAGLVERRGIGILPIEHEGACVIGLAVELLTDPEARPERYPDAPPATCLLAVKLPVLQLHATAGPRENSAMVFGYFTALLPV